MVSVEADRPLGEWAPPNLGRPTPSRKGPTVELAWRGMAAFSRKFGVLARAARSAVVGGAAGAAPAVGARTSTRASSSSSAGAALVAGVGIAGLVSGVGACTRAAPPPSAPVEIAIPPLGDAGAVAPVAAAPPDASRCTAKLRAGKIRTGPTCVLDEQISKGDGLLLYPCAGGSGPVEARFGEHRFQGTLENGNLSLSLDTELDWDDGCHWKTEQAIVGALADKRLTWTYGEHPVSGTKCFGSCQANAPITIELRDGTAADDESDDEDEDD